MAGFDRKTVTEIGVATIAALVAAPLLLALLLVAGAGVGGDSWAARSPLRKCARYDVTPSADLERLQSTIDDAVRRGLAGEGWIEQQDASVVLFCNVASPSELVAGLPHAGVDTRRFVMGRALTLAGIERWIPDRDDQRTALAVLLSLQAVVFGVFGFVLRRSRVSPWKAMPLQRAALLGLGAGVAGISLTWTLGVLQSWAGYPVREQAWVAALFTDPRRAWLLYVAAAVLVPVAEEVFFRGYVFRRLLSGSPRWVAYCGSSWLFNTVAVLMQ